MKNLLAAFAVLLSLTAFAQPQRRSVVIGSMTEKPNAVLIVNPQNSDQGVLLPQLSSGQRMSMKPDSPAEDGLIVFDLNAQSYFFWSNGSWVKLATQRHSRFARIDPADFHELKGSDNIRHNNMVIFEADNSFITPSTNGNGEDILAPLNLPHRAVLNEVTVYYMDNHASNLKVEVIRKSFTGNTDSIISWESSGASHEINAQTFLAFKGKETIDLENYTYRVIIKFDLHNDEFVDSVSEAKQRIYGLRIKYTE
mgnify:CR=1 FL=1